MSIILTSRRATLQPLSPDHVDEMHALWTNQGVRRYLWDDRVIPRETVTAVISASQADFAAYRYGLWAIVENQSGRIAGFCGLRSGFVEARSGQGTGAACAAPPELLFGLWPRYWGKGLATEAAQAVLSYAFALGYDEVVAATDVPNDASARVLERLGMRFERRGRLNGLDTLFFRKSREDHARRED
jgi:ribosomal-protein-alanine N-acetyltransferase